MKIYSIGYSGGLSPVWLRTFCENNNVAIVDTRLKPYSHRKPLWNRDNLKNGFKGRYFHFKELGNLNYKQRGGDVDIKNLKRGLDRVDYHATPDKFPGGVLFLCTCVDHHKCHRRVVIDAYGRRTGYPVVLLNKSNLTPANNVKTPREGGKHGHKEVWEKRRTKS